MHTKNELSRPMLPIFILEHYTQPDRHKL